MALIKRYKAPIVFSLLFVLYWAVGTYGYGNDSDTYGMLRTGWRLLLGISYQPSRVPGYFVPELIVGILSSVNGHLLSNLVSTILGCATLIMFYRFILDMFENDIALMITMIIGLNPYFIIASSSSIDYIYALFFIMLGITLLRSNNYIPAGISFGLAISSRLSTSVLLLPIYGYFYLVSRNHQRVNKLTKGRSILGPIVSIAVAILLGSALYIPSFIASNNSFDFFSYAIGDWGFLGHLYRFVYKNIYLFGIFAFLTIMVSAVYYLIKKRTYQFDTSLLLACALAVLFEEVLFFKVPLETSYLLPILFLIVPLWVFIVHERKSFIFLALAFTILYNFINVNILSIDYDKDNNEAIDAKVGLYMRHGILLNDVWNRQSSEEKYFSEFKLGANKYNGMSLQQVRWKRVFGINQLKQR